MAGNFTIVEVQPVVVNEPNQFSPNNIQLRDTEGGKYGELTADRESVIIKKGQNIVMFDLTADLFPGTNCIYGSSVVSKAPQV